MSLTRPKADFLTIGEYLIKLRLWPSFSTDFYLGPSFTKK
jgi:hypothetical protein